MSFVESALAGAARRRAMPGLPLTDVVRLVDDDGDDCPGLVVDRYGPVLRLELRASEWHGDVDVIARSLVEAGHARCAVGLLRSKAGVSEGRVLAGPSPPAAHVVDEDGVRLLVRTLDRDAAGAGVFVDQRVGRALVRAHARGGTVLNLFAHAGAFGAAAVAGGAARVDHVDAAKKCAPWAALNVALNGADPRRHRFIVDDAVDVVARAARKGAHYDVVICDPPTAAVRPKARGKRFLVSQDLAHLARDCVLALKPGGLLVLSTNNRELTVDDVAAVAAAAGAVRVGELALPPDVTSARLPIRPMRGVFGYRAGG